MKFEQLLNDGKIILVHQDREAASFRVGCRLIMDMLQRHCGNRQFSGFTILPFAGPPVEIPLEFIDFIPNPLLLAHGAYVEGDFDAMLAKLADLGFKVKDAADSPIVTG